MTVNSRVNPKKLHPYDEPPKRRRRRIPEGPDSAATGFLVAAALWLAAATGIGALAIGRSLVEFELSFPLAFGFTFELDQRRVDYAFINATVYGWLTNAGFAAIAFMTPRLLGRRLVAEKGLNLALVLWNLSLAGGIGALYVFDLGPNAALTAFPWLIDGGLATAAVIVTAAFLATAAASLRTSYVSLWFSAIALIGLTGLVGLNALLGLAEAFLGLPELATALASVYIERALSVVWLLGATYATLYYVIPRSTAQPLASAGIGMLSFLTWLVLAPLAGLVTLADGRIPFAVTSLGAVATMLLIVPAGLTIMNLFQTLQGRWSLLFGASTAAFAVVSMTFLISVSVLDAIGVLRPVQGLVGGTDWQRGAWMWATYGTFSFAAFALADHAMPRLLRRAWDGSLLASAQLWLAFGGVALAGLALMGGGLAEGSLRAQALAPDMLRAELLLYRGLAFTAFGLVALAGVALVVNLFLMYTSAPPAEYVVPGQGAQAPAPAPAAGR